MNLLATHPGRHGDLLWALPSVRALAESAGDPVDLILSSKYSSLQPLLKKQAYLGEVTVCDTWDLQETAPITPREPPIPLGLASTYDLIVHLGYDGWPAPDVARDTFRRVQQAWPEQLTLDLQRPWITAPYTIGNDLAVGFTDEHFELKFGLHWLLYISYHHGMVNLSSTPRWQTEGERPGFSWEAAAGFIAGSPLFVGCCSALHVLARAIGKPVVLVEPNPQRQNEVFYPYGKSGGGVELLLGNDGQPTVDARHLMDAIKQALPVCV